MQAMHVRTIVYVLHMPPPHSASYKTSARLYVCTLVNTCLAEEKHHQCKLHVSIRARMQVVCAL